MELKMVKYIREILIVALIVWVAGKYVFESPEKEIVTVSDTVYVEIEVPIDVEPEIRWLPKSVKDTTGLAELNSIIDSLQQEMNKTASDSGLGTYVAEWDSSVTGEQGERLADIELTATSRIPFDPELRFQGKLTLYNKTVTNTTEIYHGQRFWDRFSIGLNINFGYGLFSRNWDVFAGVGINYDIKDIF